MPKLTIELSKSCMEHAEEIAAVICETIETRLRLSSLRTFVEVRPASALDEGVQIVLQLYPGRSAATKRSLANALFDALFETTKIQKNQVLLKIISPPQEK